MIFGTGKGVTHSECHIHGRQSPTVSHQRGHIGRRSPDYLNAFALPTLTHRIPSYKQNKNGPEKSKQIQIVSCNNETGIKKKTEQG